MVQNRNRETCYRELFEGFEHVMVGMFGVWPFDKVEWFPGHECMTCF